MPEKKKVQPKAKAKPKAKPKAKVKAKSTVKKVLAKTTKKPVLKSDSDNDKSKKYFEAVGRRKRATARVRLFTCKPFKDEKGKITVNGKPYTEYFPTIELQLTIINPLKKMKSLSRFEVTVKVQGGGIRGQAEAVRHSLSRALVKFNPDFSKKLKRSGYLRRDPRRKERKKPGLKKARRAPQWKKR